MIDATRAGPICGLEADASISVDDDVVVGASTARPLLRSVVLVYEDRKAWVARARRSGFSQSAAEQASYWLLCRDKIKGIHGSLSEVAQARGISVDAPCELDKFLRDFPSRADAGTLIWNITDGVAGFRGSHLVSLAELHRLPYFGCPPFAHQLAQDKFKLYALCHTIGIRTPATALVERGDIIATCATLPDQGVYFVKPNALGNKIGIGQGSLCRNLDQARQQAERLQTFLHCRAVVQAFIAGPEVRVTFIDADEADESHADKYGFDVIDEHLEGEHFIDFCDRERKYERFVDFRTWPGYDGARRQRALAAMTDAVDRLSLLVRTKDYFAVDFRLDADGNPYLLDFNPGAFLYGDEVEGYARKAFRKPLPEALLCAMKRSHKRQCEHRNGVPEPAFQV